MIECEFENGNKAKLRHVTVKAVVVNEKKEVLLTKRSFKVIAGGKYDLPGGFLDHGEDTKEGALRELFEETGIKGKIEFLFKVNDNPNRRKEDRQNIDFIYVVTPIGGEFKKDFETSEVGWYSEEDIPAEDEFAFDHRDSIIKYFEYLKEPFQLPIIG